MGFVRAYSSVRDDVASDLAGFAGKTYATPAEGAATVAVNQLFAAIAPAGAISPIDGNRVVAGEPRTYQKTGPSSWLDLGDVASQLTRASLLATGKAGIGLGQVDNTADSVKPISEDQQAAIDEVDGKVTPYIWRQRPSIQTGQLTGTPSENAARLQQLTNSLSQDGGGTLRLVEDVIDIDRPIIPPYGVSIVGQGRSRHLLRNVMAGYSFRQASVILPGNFHPAYTSQMQGHANSKALAAVGAGDQAASLASPADAANFIVGDLGVFFDAVNFYLDGSANRIFLYMAIRKITKIAGATLYVDRPFLSSFAGSVYNLRTGTIAGAPIMGGSTEPGPSLFAWGGGEIGGFSIDTPGYWTSDTAIYDGNFFDIGVERARALHYGNTLQYVQFDAVGGRFMIGMSETSLNSESVTISNFDAVYDAAAAAALSAQLGTTVQFAQGVSLQENGIGTTIRNGTLDVTGATGGPIFRTINFEQGRLENFSAVHKGTSFSGTVVGADNNVGVGRRQNRDTYTDIRWRGPCGDFVNIGLSYGAYIDGDFFGTPANRAIFFNAAAVQRNEIAPTAFFENGPLTIVAGAANQEVAGAYVGGGVTAIVGGDWDKLKANTITRVRTAKTSRRKAANNASNSTQTVTGTAVKTPVMTNPLGAGLIQYGDVIDFAIRLNLTGVAGSKVISIDITDTSGPTVYGVLTFTIPAPTTGILNLSARISIQTQSRIFAAGQSDQAAVVLGGTGQISGVDLSAKPLTFTASVTLSAAADSAGVQYVKSTITNPVQE